MTGATTGGLITIFGGSGFVGRYVARALCRQGWRVRVAVRRPHLAGELRMAGEVGQVQIVQANVRNRPSIERALDGADAAVNLVGILFEKGRQSFDGTQALGAANVAELAAAAGIKRFVQMSAIGADAESKSQYARSKADAEAAVLEHLPSATILRPSIVFGPEDEFFNRFAQMARYAPALPLIGGGNTKFQPLFVDDLADAVLAALTRDDAQGRIYELGGPNTYSFKELLSYILTEVDRPRFLAPLPFFAAKPLGVITSVAFKFYPFMDPPITGDQVELLKSDNIVGATDEDLGRIEDLGIGPLETVEAVVPDYLWRYRPYGEFHQSREDEVSRVDV